MLVKLITYELNPKSGVELNNYENLPRHKKTGCIYKSHHQQTFILCTELNAHYIIFTTQMLIF